MTTTVDDILLALPANGDLTWASSLPVAASIQSVSNALRHAEGRGLVERMKGLSRRSPVRWRLTTYGQARRSALASRQR